MAPSSTVGCVRRGVCEELALIRSWSKNGKLLADAYGFADCVEHINNVDVVEILKVCNSTRCSVLRSRAHLN
jgi:hypothetical protein